MGGCVGGEPREVLCVLTSLYKVYFVFTWRKSQTERGKVGGFCSVSIRPLVRCHVCSTGSFIDQLMDCKTLLLFILVPTARTLEDLSTIPHSAKIKQHIISLMYVLKGMSVQIIKTHFFPWYPAMLIVLFLFVGGLRCLSLRFLPIKVWGRILL